MSPSTVVEVKLSMRKIGEPGVTIGWELILIDEGAELGAADRARDCRRETPVRR